MRVRGSRWRARSAALAESHARAALTAAYAIHDPAVEARLREQIAAEIGDEYDKVAADEGATLETDRIITCDLQRPTPRSSHRTGPVMSKAQDEYRKKTPQEKKEIRRDLMKKIRQTLAKIDELLSEKVQ
jgi:hypothetical protein